MGDDEEKTEIFMSYNFYLLRKTEKKNDLQTEKKKAWKGMENTGRQRHK